MIAYLVRKFNLITGMAFCYEIKVTYYRKQPWGEADGMCCTAMSSTLFLPNKRAILNRRAIRKCFGSWAADRAKRTGIKNGILSISHVSYLGWMKQAKR